MPFNIQLTFNGVAFQGLPLEFVPAAPEYLFFRTHFAGVNGVSEITGGRGARTISIPVVVFGKFLTRDAIQEYVDNNLNREGLALNGQLAYVSTGTQRWNRTYDDCTFEGFSLLSPPGFLPDEAGTLDGGWWCLGALKFTQLSQS